MAVNETNSSDETEFSLVVAGGLLLLSSIRFVVAGRPAMETVVVDASSFRLGVRLKLSTV